MCHGLKTLGLNGSTLMRQQLDEPLLKGVKISAKVARGTRVDNLALGDDADLAAKTPDLLRVVTAQECRDLLFRG